jgi:plasmid stabilization system protein ParE
VGRRVTRVPHFRSAKVIASAHFVADLKAQVAWLRRDREGQWVDRLEGELNEARELLSSLPFAGVPHSSEAGVRSLLLRGLPFVIWYATKGRKQVLLLRLFHVRQFRVR